MNTHQDKIAIVTGGRQGIGHGVAKLLAERGATVVLVNRSDAGEAAAAIGNGAIAVKADVTSEADWARVAGEVDQRFGRVDILVHAAGAYPMDSLAEMMPETWRGVMALNLDSHLLGARAIVPLMRQAGGGSIVAIGSDAVSMVTPPGFGFSHYITWKMGVVGLARALASELAPDNLIVNVVHPGITDTEGASGMPNEQKAQVYMQQAIKRLGTPAEPRCSR